MDDVRTSTRHNTSCSNSKWKLKVSSFKSSDDINKNENWPYRSQCPSKPGKTWQKEPKKSTVFFCNFLQDSRCKDWYKPKSIDSENWCDVHVNASFSFLIELNLFALMFFMCYLRYDIDSVGGIYQLLIASIDLDAFST